MKTRVSKVPSMKKINSLLDMSRRHEQNNESWLSKAYAFTANYEINKMNTINKILDGMSLGNYPEAKMTQRDNFKTNWYKLEDTYVYNF